MLVVVEDRDLHARAQRALDVEAVGRLDVLEVDAAEGRLERRDQVDQLVEVLLVDLDVEDVDAGELLEQDALAFHHRLGGERADVAEAEHGRAVGDDGDQVAARGVAEGVGRVGDDLLARRGDAGRIGEREVVLVDELLGRGDRDLARRRKLVVVERGAAQLGGFLFGVRHDFARRGRDAGPRDDRRPSLQIGVAGRTGCSPGRDALPARAAGADNRSPPCLTSANSSSSSASSRGRPGAPRSASATTARCSQPTPGMTLAVSTDMLVEGRHFLSTVRRRPARPQGARRQPERPRRLRRAAARLHAGARAAARRRGLPRRLCARPVRARRPRGVRAGRRRHDARPARHLHHRLRRAARRRRAAALGRARRATTSTSAARSATRASRSRRFAARPRSTPTPSRRCAGRWSCRRRGRRSASRLRGVATQRDRRLRRPDRRPRPRAAPLGRRCASSTSTRLPRSAVLAAQPLELQRECLLAGGDDYELVFTALASRRDAVAAAAASAGVAVRRIGRIDAGAGLRLVDRGGDEVASALRLVRPLPRLTRAIDPRPGHGRRTRAASAARRRRRRPGWRFLLAHPAHLIALGFGSGLSPCAPGTSGTLWAWLVYAVPRRCSATARAAPSSAAPRWSAGGRAR